MLTPLAVSPGQPFPFISPLSLSLGVLVRDPDSAEERFARVKVPEGLPRFLELGPRRLRLPLEDVIAHFLDELFPGMEILEQAVFRISARRRPRARRRRRRPARGRPRRGQPAAVRRRRARGGRLDDVEEDDRPPPHRSRRRRGRDLRGAGHARPLRGDGDRGARPAGAEGRPVAADHAGAPEAAAGRRRPLLGDPPQRHPRPPPVRVLHDELRGVHPHRGGRPGGDRAEDDRLPDERRVADRAVADRGGRARQADGVPGRAQGPRRRAEEHRVGAQARAGGRPRRVRLPRPEDPREDDARRQARGRPPAPLRPHRHGELPRGHGALLRGPEPLHRRRADHRRRRRPLQLRDGLRPADEVPQAPRRAADAEAASGRADPLGRDRGRRPASARRSC